MFGWLISVYDIWTTPCHGQGVHYKVVSGGLAAIYGMSFIVEAVLTVLGMRGQPLQRSTASNLATRCLLSTPMQRLSTNLQQPILVALSDTYSGQLAKQAADLLSTAVCAQIYCVLGA